jgi:hypothetical protein
MTHQFEGLKARIVYPDPNQDPRNKWISAKMQKLVAHQIMLRRTGWLCHSGGRGLMRGIWASLWDDHTARTK